MTKKVPPRQNANQHAAATLRCPMMLNGIVACAFMKYWMITKTIVNMPKRVRHKMMRQLDHAYDAPPHCSASRQTTMLTMKTLVPIRSSWLARSRSGTLVSALRTGEWKNIRMTATVTAPMGRLI